MISFQGTLNNFKNTAMYQELFLGSKNEEDNKGQDMDKIIEDVFDPLFSAKVILPNYNF